MTQLYAQPYNIDATGFYFEDADEFDKKSQNCFSIYGEFIEEFEIQWIDGEAIDRQLFKEFQISMSDIHYFLERIAEWDDDEKTKALIYLELNPNTDIEGINPEVLNLLK